MTQPEKKAAILAAIRDLFGDTSVSAIQTRDDLEEISIQIGEFIEVIDCGEEVK